MRDSFPFERLLRAAGGQAPPQRLLFVFARVDLPDDPSPEQRERFSAGRGGMLTPLMCLDKAPGDLPNFEALAMEAQSSGPPWQLVFAAALPGAKGEPPSEAQIGPAFETMVHAVWRGEVTPFAAYTSAGDAVTFG